MTQPNPDGAGGNAGDGKDKASTGNAGAGKADKSAAPALAVAEVVVYTRHDPILRTSHQAIGVVVELDDQAAMVRPLAHHDVRVPLADVTRYADADAEV